jgi:hypothetical protein
MRLPCMSPQGNRIWKTVKMYVIEEKLYKLGII